MSYERARQIIASLPDSNSFTATVNQKFWDAASHRFPQPLFLKWCDVISALYQENIPTVPLEPTPDTLEHAQWRDKINAVQYPDIPKMEQAIVDCMLAFARHLPNYGRLPKTEHDKEGQTEVPLVDVIRDKGELVGDMIRPLVDLFPNTFKQYATNVLRLNNDKSVKPRDFKGDPLLYLEYTPLLKPFFTWIPVTVPDEQRFSGTWIVAPPGRGKTTLLHSHVLKDLETEACVILMDSKGDLIEPFKTCKPIEANLITIEPSEEYPLALNPLDIGHRGHQAIGLLEYIFSTLLEAKMTPLQSTLFRSSLRAALATTPTMQHFRNIITDGVPKGVKLPVDLRDFFDKEFPTKTYSETRQQIQWRLRLLLENPIISAMFSAPKTKLDIGKEMNAGRTIIINNSKALLGEEGAEFFGRFFIALVLNAAQQRAGQEHKRPCYFYIDECQNVIRRDEKITTILDECRSQKIAMTLAHQRLAQITPAVLDALSNCAIRYANSDDDATALAPKLRTTADNLRSLSVGTFACYVRDVGVFNLKVPYHDLAHLPQMTEDEQLQHRARMILRYSTDLPQEEPERVEQDTLQQAPEHSDTKTEVDPDNISTARRKDW